MFDDFWQKYPKKESKGAARKSYEKAIKEKKVLHETIMSGLSKYLERIDEKKVERQFIKMPATWLNQECWDDEFDVRPSLRQKLNEVSDGEDIYQQTTREQAERVEAANRWWKDNGHAPKLAHEYTFRCKRGEPGPEDLAQFEMQKRAQAATAVHGFQTVEAPETKPKEVMPNEQPGRLSEPDKTDPRQVAGGEPPEPPPVQSEAEYGGIR